MLTAFAIKHKCRKDLLLRQFSGRLTEFNSLLLSSDGHLGALLIIKLIFMCSNNFYVAYVFSPW